jgi:hypothetical protein
LSSTGDNANLKTAPDELTGYFFSSRTGTNILYTATRASIQAPFGNVTEIPNVNVFASQINPEISPDQLILWFAATRPGQGLDILYSERSSLTAAFSAPQPMPYINSTADELQPYFQLDGTTLYFMRHVTVDQLFLATGNDVVGFMFPTAMGVNDSNNNHDPVVSHDGLTLYWSSDRPGGIGDHDVWMATRASTSTTFGSVQHVPNVNTALFDAPSFVSQDDCRLYLTHREAAGNLTIYVAERPPPM